MPIDYNAKDAVKAWPEGNYAAELTYVKDTATKPKPGKPSSPMQEWHFAVYDDANDRQQALVEYFVPPGSTFKLKQLAAALNKSDLFERNEFQADDAIGSRVVLGLKIESSDQFGDKNKIQSIKALAAQPAAPRPTSTRPRAMQPAAVNGSPAIEGDDIPF